MIPKSQMLFPGQSGHRFSVMRLAAFHHSNKIASCSFDGTVRIWEDKKQRKTLFFFTEAIESLEITPNDAKIIVVLSDSSKAFIHNIFKEETQEIGQGKLFRNIFGTNPSSTKTAFVTFDDEVFIYNHVNNSLSSHTNVENISGDSLAWLDDDLFCIPKRNGSVVIIDSNTRGIKGEQSLHDGLITSIVKNGDELITVSEDGTGKVHDLTFEPKFGFKIPFTPQSVCYSLKDRLVVVSGDRNLMFVDTTNGQLTNTDQELSGCNPIITNNSEIYRGSGENDISQFSNTGEIIAKMSGRSKTAESISFLDKKSIVYGSGDGNVYLLNYFDNEEKQLTTHSESVSSIIHLRGSNRIIAGSFDDSISIWDLNQQTEIKRIPNVPLVTTLALSPSNALFVAGCSGDNSIHVFKADGEKITSWVAHDDFISVVSFLNDEVIVSGSDDKTIRFWNTSGKLISTLNVSASVKSIYTTSESEFIVVGLENGELLLYEKLSNRKIISHISSSSIQCIRMINGSLIYFAAKNILYQMRLDGPNIIDITNVCQHEEPIRGIKWIPNEELIISFDHSIQIKETRFIYEEKTDKLIEDEEESPTTVVFAPEEPSTEEAYQHADESEHESLTSILEYLNTVSTQVTTLVLPRLLEMGINAEQLVDSLQELENKITEKLNQTESKNNVEAEDQEEEMSPDEESDWKEFDWGRKRH